jgi:hypothetical protein
MFWPGLPSVALCVTSIRHAVEIRQLDHVAVGHQPGQHPGAGRGHLDLALQQRLGDVEVGEQLARMEHLAGQLALRFLGDLGHEVEHRHVARMAGRGVERARIFERLGGAQDGGRGEYRYGQGCGSTCKGAPGQADGHRESFPSRADLVAGRLSRS